MFAKYNPWVPSSRQSTARLSCSMRSVSWLPKTNTKVLFGQLEDSYPRAHLNDKPMSYSAQRHHIFHTLGFHNYRCVTNDRLMWVITI
jgi:hypothetical protein